MRGLREAIPSCLYVDQRRLGRRLDRLVRSGRGIEVLEAFAQELDAARARAERRRRAVPAVRLPDELPISAHREQIAAALASHQVLIVCGETGSGKSTQIPKICLALGRGVLGLIGHTQPRRIAARSLAARIASELGEAVGQGVGFKVRFREEVGTDTYIKLMTDGVLLAEIESDPGLERYDTLIIDEAHERSLNIDFLLGYLKGLLPRRPELKLIITSATIDPERYSRQFGDAPVIEVSGRGHPVELRYRPLEPEGQGALLEQAISAAVAELPGLGDGDCLVFLPGEREIHGAAEVLRKRRGIEVLPLYARLSSAEQDRVYAPHQGRRVVLATNLAETSLTVPGIRYVIDSGLARINRYDPRSKVQRLVQETISKASAEQRAGRCGRLGPGVCIRLYAREDFESRPDHTDPETLRANCAAVCLKLLTLGISEIEGFPFLDPPEPRAVKAAFKLLEELGAVEAPRRLTALGRQLARLPVDPRIGRMVLGGHACACLREVLIIAAGLSIQDPRERPLGAEAQADEAHRRFHDKGSDFLWFLNLWRYYHEQAPHLSQAKRRALCREHFLSYLRLQEWLEIEAQLRAVARDLGLFYNEAPADPAAIHRALLSGLLGHIGFRTDRHEYTGARGTKFQIFPGSGLFKKPPAWVVAGELVQTSRLYARTVAGIDPEWVEEAAPDLIKRHYSEPHWERRAGRAAAWERVTLYGLTLVQRRRVDYSAIDPAESRRLLIQVGLIEEELQTRGSFLRHNRAQIEAIEALQHRARRLDLLADEARRFEFYDRRIPPQLGCAVDFERWREAAERADPRLLHFPREVLLRDGAEAVSEEDYPLQIEVDGQALPLCYRFEPGHEADGVTVRVPLLVLNQLDPRSFDWLVPGLLCEKIAGLLRLLPKSIRRQIVPIEAMARRCAERLRPDGRSLTEALGEALKELCGLEISQALWDQGRLPDHLKMRYCIVDPGGRVLAEGRDLEDLHRRLGRSVAAASQSRPRWPIEREHTTTWDFGDLPERVEARVGGILLRGYPALADRGTEVAIRVYETREAAVREGREGLRRLLMLAVRDTIKYLKKPTPQLQRMALLHRALGSREALVEDLLAASIERVYLQDRPEIRTELEFKARLAEGRGRLIPAFDECCALVLDILDHAHRLQALLDGIPQDAPCVSELRDQLRRLLPPGFATATAPERLRHFPRYLKAMVLRVERMLRDPARDRQRAARIAPFWHDCLARLDSTPITPALEQFRWMIEELRVSLFAQELGTAQPVSETRLKEQWRRVCAEGLARERVA